MPIILRNLRIENCEICVDIGDHANQGIAGILKFEISGESAKEKKVKLFFPPRTECITPTQRDGKIHTVTAILTAGGEVEQETKALLFCK
jgi:hypothetical protein